MSSRGSASKRPRYGDRTLVACLGCKQRKQKCDGQSPTCRNCSRLGRECLVEDPATGRQQPRNYLQSLEQRVAELEGMLQRVAPEVAFDHFTIQGQAGEPLPTSPTDVLFADQSTLPASSRLASSLVPPATSPTTALEAEETDQANDLSPEVALLCLNAAGREPHYFGPSSALSFSRVLSAALRQPKARSPHSMGIGSGDPGHVLHDKPRTLKPPSRAAGALLSRAYFDNIHPQYPFLHRDTFQSWETEFMDAKDAGDLGTASHLTLFFVLMVYAIGSLITTRGGYDVAETYYTAAQEHIEHVIQMDSVESIQAILCCAMYSIRSPVGASVWRLSGMALRHCIELGYHRHIRRPRPARDFLTAEMTKRVFWVAYDMDRAAAFTLGRPFGIMDKDIDVGLPLDVDDSAVTPAGLTSTPRTSPTDPPTSMSGAIHIIRLRRIWSKIHENLYPGISLTANAGYRRDVTKEIRQDLDSWYASTPTQAAFPSNQPLSVFTSQDWFQLAYSHSVLLLYRRHLVPSRSARRGGLETADGGSAFAECANHARQICLLYRRLYASHTVRYTWGSLHILFLAGITYLHCLWTSPTVRDATRSDDVYMTCTACTMVLVIISERWNAAASFRDTFEALASRTTRMICEVGSATNNDGSLYPQTLRDENTQEGDTPSELLTMDDWMTGVDMTDFPGGMEWLLENASGCLDSS